MSILLFSTLHLRAQGIIYECVDGARSGQRQNAKSIPLCKKVESPITGNSNRAAIAHAATPAEAFTSPADFPRIGEATQKARDSDRKQILLDELHSEDKKLSRLLREYNNGVPERLGDEKGQMQYQERTLALKDEVVRSGKNVEAIKRELSKLN